MVRRYGIDRVEKAYPGWPRDALKTLLGEVDRSVVFEYEPFTEYRPVPMHGRYITIDERGFRHVAPEGPWPPDPKAWNVFVFGGSTANGVGVADADTLPSHLQKILSEAHSASGVHVYNFARPAYYSFQERILFDQLLLAGFVPRTAVFVDGLNDNALADHRTAPYFWAAHKTDEMRALVESARRDGSGARFARLFAMTPLSELLYRVRDRFEPDPKEEPFFAGAPVNMVRRWVENREMIERVASDFAVRTLFVWQPIPFYRYDLRYHLFPEEGLRPPRSTAGYDLMRARFEGASDPHLLWLADLQEGRHENFYVDGYHYTSAFSRTIAAEIAKAIPE
jgi:hypothetical protein